MKEQYEQRGICFLSSFRFYLLGPGSRAGGRLGDILATALFPDGTALPWNDKEFGQRHKGPHLIPTHAINQMPWQDWKLTVAKPLELRKNLELALPFMGWKFPLLQSRSDRLLQKNRETRASRWRRPELGGLPGVGAGFGRSDACEGWCKMQMSDVDEVGPWYIRESMPH